MQFTEQDLEHLERLARVRISSESRAALREQLARIIEFVRTLQRIDTEGIEPRAYVGEFEPRLRADEPRECLPREEVLGEAPDPRDAFFGVPPVIETEEP